MRPSLLFEMQPNKDNSAFAASLVIPSRNRRTELRELLLSAQKQTVPLEVIVIDDGSIDGTSEMVRAEFPRVRLESRSHSRGYIVRRNEGARLAISQFIFSLDDDAEFSSPKIIAQTIAEFDHPRIGAVAIPLRNLGEPGGVCQKAPNNSQIWVTSEFIGTAHAIRRDVFFIAGGYREELVHQGEESDLCLRLLSAGYVVRAGSSDPILHDESPLRDFARRDFYGRRNDILFAWHNVPMPYLPIHLAATTLNGFAHAATRAKHPFRMLSGIMNGYRDCARRWSNRCPVRASVYRLHRQLKKHGPLPLLAIEHDLPSLSIEVSGSAAGAHVFSER
jgi:glycosyltransferase involved in cell wall biosynthesis